MCVCVGVCVCVCVFFVCYSLHSTCQTVAECSVSGLECRFSQSSSLLSLVWTSACWQWLRLYSTSLVDVIASDAGTAWSRPSKLHRRRHLTLQGSHQNRQNNRRQRALLVLVPDQPQPTRSSNHATPTNCRMTDVHGRHRHIDIIQSLTVHDIVMQALNVADAMIA